MIASILASADLTSAVGGAVLLTALPLLAIAATSFIKISVVLAILRQALGAPSVPPTSVLTALAAVLSVFVMAPVGEEVLAALSAVNPSQGDALGLATAKASLAAALPPIEEFLAANTPGSELAFFADLAGLPSGEPPSLRLLLPAFAVSQVAEAFLIGVIVYLPFLVVDLLVSAGLLALGMTSLSPLSVSLPLKLLLFVAVDGWHLLLSGLLVGYGT